MVNHGPDLGRRKYTDYLYNYMDANVPPPDPTFWVMTAAIVWGNWTVSTAESSRA